MHFLFFKKQVNVVNSCLITHEGKKGSDVVSKDGRLNIPSEHLSKNKERFWLFKCLFVKFDFYRAFINSKEIF